MNKPLEPATRLVHSGGDPQSQFGFVNPPVYHGSTILFPNTEDLLAGRAPYTYGRRGSPTTDALREVLQSLDGSAGVLLCQSGLSAIATTLTAVLGAGEHLLMVDTAYGPTRVFCTSELKRFGIETTFYDPLIGAGIEALIRPNTRLIFTESPGSLTFEVQDIPAIAAVAARHAIPVALDNTWATPLFFDAFGHGADIVIQAGTKYISGHSDIMLGVISANARWLPRLTSAWTHFGISVGPDDMFLGLRGLRTMAVRLKHQEQAALEIATWLHGRDEVRRVLHPALPDFPGNALFKRDFLGSSGVFSIELHPAPKARLHAMLDGLALFGLGFSWGGMESLAIPFDVTQMRTATQWHADGPCIRFSIGLEAVDDLKADLEAGLGRLHA